MPHSPSARHKTVFILDHSPLFARSCKESVEYDILSKNKPGIIPAAPIYKSLWTCCVETVLEYVRVVYDIFPNDKLLRLVTGTNVLNTWSGKEQNMSQMMQGLAQVGPPDASSDGDEFEVVHGLTQAIETLCQPSDLQKQMMETEDRDYINNQGRIICLTSVKSDAQVRMLEECVSDALDQHNSLAAEKASLLPVTHCDLVLVHIVPVGDPIKVASKATREVSSMLTSEVHSTEGGRYLYNKMIELVYNHYNLTSTTVTGIPMKEEQNASSSANYDVELLHPIEAHEELLRSAPADGLVIQSKEGLPINTITLKWCTPKSNIQDLPACTGAYRITPVDVNSRPSSCLTNFLLSGRAVMLEQPRKTGLKVISHMLASHGGEIFIHSISTARSILEDPPSISEGLGGRVTDYRIPDFREFMKENRLAPASSSMLQGPVKPTQRALKYLERASRCWPMVISDTIIFNMASHIDPLPSLLVKEILSDEDLLDCKKAILYVVGMEARNEPLPVATSSRGKAGKREHQYAQMWTELETLVRAHADTSDNHQKVLECLLDCKKPSLEEQRSRKSTERPVVKEEKMDTDVDLAVKELERFQKMTEREKQEFNKADNSDDNAPPSKRMRPGFEGSLGKMGGGQNLLSLWTNRIKSVHSKCHAEFAGREESSGNTAVLYRHLFEDEKGEET